MMFRVFFQITLSIMFMFPSMAKAADPVIGHWLTENERAVIEMKECGKSVCGSIYWIIEGGMQFDEKNPDEALKARKICGLEILNGFQQKEAGSWSGGDIYKADDGDTYSAKLKIQEDGTLRLRGYIGTPLLGKTQIWTRVDASDYAQCE